MTAPAVIFYPNSTALAYAVSVLRARAMTGAQKVEEGCESFERQCGQLLEAVKSEMPGGCDEMLMLLVRERLRAQFPQP